MARHSRPQDDSIREWSDFLAKQGEASEAEAPSAAERAVARSGRIKDPVISHRSIATLEGRSVTLHCLFG